MNEYESLIILNANSHEQSEEEMLAVVKSEFEGVGAEITEMEKMGKKGFSRIAKKKYAAGIYINLRFKAETEAVESLKSKFIHNKDVLRVLVKKGSPTLGSKGAAAALAETVAE